MIEIRPLEKDDDRRSFRSGDESLDLFFHRYAGQNQFRHHVGVTYVALEADEIVGFATVSPATLDADVLPSGKRRPPYPAPLLRVARLAVADTARGRGIGQALLRFCIELAWRLREEVGCVGLLVDAKPEAIEYYERFGLVVVEALEGVARSRPEPTPMFIALESTRGS